MNKLITIAIMLSLSFGQKAFSQLPEHDLHIPRALGGVGNFPELYSNWEPGKPYNPAFADDEQFFVSRVKKRVRFDHKATQIKEWLNPKRKILWWVPLGSGGANGQVINRFDSETFSHWTYIDTWGNWNHHMNPPTAAYADACHKNGVNTAVTANMGWATNMHANTPGWGPMWEAMRNGGTTKFFNWLKYYGLEGYGLNSEFNFTPDYANVYRDWIKSCFAVKDENGVPNFAHIWYGFMSSAGRIGGSVNQLATNNQGWFHHNGEKVSQHYMTNYHWSASGMQSAVNVANNCIPKRSGFDSFVGCDIQGWDFGPFSKLLNYEVSIGFWGAHTANMVWESRARAYGPSADGKQRCYRERLENFFGGSTRNPVNSTPVNDDLQIAVNLGVDWHGMCSFITAKSVLQGNIAEQPFVSYFNLGNGKYFNENGVTTNSTEWYNLGMQDFLPTWRYWFTSNWLGKNKNDVVSNGLKAEFTYEDAWFGGSCMKIYGGTSNEYLHLFKTKYPLVDGDQVTVRYKVLSGTGNIKLAGCVEGNETVAITPATRIIKANEAQEAIWKEYTCTIGSGIKELNAANEVLAVLGLQIYDTTDDFEILLGEMSLRRGDAVTPDAPEIKANSTTVFKSSMKGIDFRLVYSMQKDVPLATKLYNIDVNTWFYKIYMEQEGEEPVLLTATTAWAASCNEALFNISGIHKVRLGVSAVALDGKSESKISWTDPITLPELTIIKGLEIDKKVIKADEDFTVSFKDKSHANAVRFDLISHLTGEIINSYTDVTEFTTSLPDEGFYNVTVVTNEFVLDEDGKETSEKEDVARTYFGLVQISSDEVGSIPEILTLTANDSSDPITVELEEDVTLDYTGRKSDGTVSRGLKLGTKGFFIRAKDFGIEHAVDDFTFSFWMKVHEFNHLPTGTTFLNIVNPRDRWPSNNWGSGKGWILKGSNKIFFDNVTPSPGVDMATINPLSINHFPDYSVEAGVWTHFCFTWRWLETGKTEMRIWLNGKLFYDLIKAPLRPYADYDQFRIGGPLHAMAALDATIDEVKFYKEAFTGEQIRDIVMKATAPDDVPSSLVAYYDFENDGAHNGAFSSTGSNTSIKAGLANLVNGGTVEFCKGEFGAGAPFIAGPNYVVETKPEWAVLDGNVTNDESNNDLLGTATAAFGKEGQKTVKLTLKNSWGEDSRDFEYVTVVGPITDVDDNVENVLSYMAYPNPFHDEVAIQFAKGGDYALEIYDLTGKSVYKKNIQAIDKQFITVNLNAPAGLYLLKVASEGKIMKVLKLVKK